LACISDNGTLSPIGKQVLAALRSPGSEADIATSTGLPLYRVRSSIRELTSAGLLLQSSSSYQITEAGLDHLNQ